MLRVVGLVRTSSIVGGLPYSGTEPYHTTTSGSSMLDAGSVTLDTVVPKINRGSDLVYFDIAEFR